MTGAPEGWAPFAIPDGLPTLSAGPHPQDSGKACVMEYVSVITGDIWTDYPKSTNPIVARVAQTVNDYLPDDLRHLLVPFIDRLASAGGTSYAFREEIIRVVGEASTETITLYEDAIEREPEWDSEKMLGSAAGDVVGRSMRRFDPFIGIVATPEKGVEWLDRILTIHEELVKHEVKPIPPEELARAKTLIETRALVV